MSTARAKVDFETLGVWYPSLHNTSTTRAACSDGKSRRGGGSIYDHAGKNTG